jgi:hypothetical protein
MVKSYRYPDIQPSLGCPEIRGSVAHHRAEHDSSIFLKPYNKSETTSGMRFGAVLYISGLRYLISGDLHIGKKSNPH